MTQIFANNAQSTVASMVSPSDTTIQVASGEGALFPSPSGGDYFRVTLTQAGTESSWEIVTCTSRSGDVLTVDRAQEGTGAATWAVGSKVELRLTAGVLWPPALGGTGVANAPESTITISGAFPSTLTLTGVTSITLPTSGTLATTAQLPAGADPTGNIGFTATAGSAATLMRSDATPALSTTLVTPGASSFSMSTASDLGAPTPRGNITFTTGANDSFPGSSLEIGGAGVAAGLLNATAGGAMALTAGTSATLSALDITLEGGNDTRINAVNGMFLTSGANVLVEANQIEWNITTSASITTASLSMTVDGDTFISIAGNLFDTIDGSANVDVVGELQCNGLSSISVGAATDLTVTTGAGATITAQGTVAVSSVTGQVTIGADTGILLQSPNGPISAQDASFQIITPGKGLDIAEGADARSGLATLVGGTVTVATSAVTANSRIQLTAQNMGTITVPAARDISARTPGVGFTILSSDATDTSDIAWLIVEPV